MSQHLRRGTDRRANAGFLAVCLTGGLGRAQVGPFLDKSRRRNLNAPTLAGP
jgi:hypothetical protein